MKSYTIEISHCPNCCMPLGIVRLPDQRVFIKCSDGCTKSDIVRRLNEMYPKHTLPKPPKLGELLPDNVFLEVIKYARSIGKMIKRVDLDHELLAWNRVNIKQKSLGMGVK